MKTKNSIYLILTIILVILSTIAGYFLIKIYQGQSITPFSSSSIPKIELIPTDSIAQPTREDASASSVITTPKITPNVSLTKAPLEATPTAKVLLSPSPTTSVATTSGDLISYQNTKDSFSLQYFPKRKIYENVEPTLYDLDGDKSLDSSLKGNLYTFFHSTGSFAVHVSPSQTWSWTHPDRKFDNNYLVSGMPTFVHKISTQTIVDLQNNNKNYTIQCVHNGVADLKTECEDFISSFKLL